MNSSRWRSYLTIPPEQVSEPMPETNKQQATRVAFSLELSPALAPVLDTEGRLYPSLHEALSQGLSDILETLGLPGTPHVQVTTPDEHAARPDPYLRVLVHGQVCPYSAELLQRVFSYVTRTLPAKVSPSQILEWLTASSDQQDGASDAECVEFLSMAALETVKRDPAVLLGLDQVVAYQTMLPDLGPAHESPQPDTQPGSWPPDPAWLASVLNPVLGLGISIANTSVIAKTLHDGLLDGRSQEDIIEDVIDALSPDVIDILIAQEDLRTMTMAHAGKGYDNFVLLRDGLFYELGLRYPNFRFVHVEHLKPNSFGFKISHLPSLPCIGLEPNECLVNDTPSRLRLLNIDGKPTTNPANANESSVIAIDDQDVVESAGLTTWNPLAYLVLSFAAELRAHSALFVNRRSVVDLLEQLKQAFPALVNTVQGKVPGHTLINVLRALVKEEISIRNMYRILEKMLDYESIVTDPSKYIIFDDRFPIRKQPGEKEPHEAEHLTSFIRSGLKRYISHKYTRGASTLMVYLLAPEIEQLLSRHVHEDTQVAYDERDQIVEAVQAEATSFSGMTSDPVILTTTDIRAVLRNLIAPELPRLPVLAYRELSPEMNIQPIARIALDAY